MKNVLFVGSKELGYAVLKKIFALSPENLLGCCTIDDRKDSRSKFDEINAWGDANSVKVHTLGRSQELEDAIRIYKPDICFVVGWYGILPKKILELVSEWIGIHNSLLPLYRGHAPLVWSMINGGRDVGFSIFSISEGMDEGDLYYQEKIPVSSEDYIEDVISRIQNHILHFFQLHYKEILMGRLIPYKQKNGKATYAAKRCPNDGIINWDKTATEIYDFIRAQSKPYPGAFSYVGQDKVTIWRAMVSSCTFYGTPGQIGCISKKDGDVYVVCGDNTALLLNEIDVNGSHEKPNEYFTKLSLRFDGGVKFSKFNSVLSDYFNLRNNMLAQWDRVLPLGDYFVDRWEKAKFCNFGEGTNIYDTSIVMGNVVIGRDTWVGMFTVLDGSGGLTIGDHCCISAGVQIYTHSTVEHCISGGVQTSERQPVNIGNRCYIGPMSVIGMGVTLGNQCIVGANSFVNKSYPDGSIVAGTPAKKLE